MGMVTSICSQNVEKSDKPNSDVPYLRAGTYLYIVRILFLTSKPNI